MEIGQTKRAKVDVIIWDSCGTEKWTEEMKEKTKIAVIHHLFEGDKFPEIEKIRQDEIDGKSHVEAWLNNFHFYLNPKKPVPKRKKFDDKFLVSAGGDGSIRQDGHGILAGSCGHIAALTMACRISFIKSPKEVPSVKNIQYQKIRSLGVACIKSAIPLACFSYTFKTQRDWLKLRDEYNLERFNKFDLVKIPDGEGYMLQLESAAKVFLAAKVQQELADIFKELEWDVVHY